MENTLTSEEKRLLGEFVAYITVKTYKIGYISTEHDEHILNQIRTRDILGLYTSMQEYDNLKK